MFSVTTASVWRPAYLLGILLLQFCEFTYLSRSVQVSALRYVPDNVSWQSVGVALGVAAVCVAAAVYISRQ